MVSTLKLPVGIEKIVKRKYLMSFLKECSKHKVLQMRKAFFVTIL